MAGNLNCEITREIQKLKIEEEKIRTSILEWTKFLDKELALVTQKYEALPEEERIQMYKIYFNLVINSNELDNFLQIYPYMANILDKYDLTSVEYNSKLTEIEDRIKSFNERESIAKDIASKKKVVVSCENFTNQICYVNKKIVCFNEKYDEVERVVKLFCSQSGAFTFDIESNKNHPNYKDMLLNNRYFTNKEEIFDSLFWEYVDKNNGFSICPSCGQTPNISRYGSDPINPGSDDGVLVKGLYGFHSREKCFVPISSVDCCEHLWDFKTKKRYISLSKIEEMFSTITYRGQWDVCHDQQVTYPERGVYCEINTFDPYYQKRYLISKFLKDENIKSDSIILIHKKELEENIKSYNERLNILIEDDKSYSRKIYEENLKAKEQGDIDFYNIYGSRRNGSSSNIDYKKYFWENIYKVGGFSTCPTCNKRPNVINCYTRYDTSDSKYYNMYIMNTSPEYHHGGDGVYQGIYAIVCCEHLFDFKTNIRYIRYDKIGYTKKLKVNYFYNSTFKNNSWTDKDNSWTDKSTEYVEFNCDDPYDQKAKHEKDIIDTQNEINEFEEKLDQAKQKLDGLKSKSF